MKPFINCSGCCDYCLATECDYRKTESLTYTTTEPIKTEDKQMKENEKQFLKAVEIAKQRLAAGEKPENIFDAHYMGFNDGFARVKLNGKWNYINRNGDILSDVWFDRCYDFHDGFACVVVNGKGNYIDCNGKLISDTWFDDCGFFQEGFARVNLNGKWNFISREGKYFSDTWFNDCGSFDEGFAPVVLNGERYRLRKDGVLCDYKTKEPVEPDHPVSIDYKKKYEEAIERMKSWARGEHPECFTEAQKAAEFVFPELKESEDDRIGRQLLNWFKDCKWTAIDNETLQRDDIIAWLEKQDEQPNPYSGISFEYNGHIWGMCARDNGVDILLDKQLFTHLEKQGEQIDYNEELKKCKENPLYFYDKYVKIKIKEQKPTDKTESKFKTGDWIIFNGLTLYVKEVVKGYYRTTSIGGVPNSYDWDIDGVARLWTIQEAKDGDVLTTHISPEGDWIGMYKQSTDDTFNTYCFLNAIGEFVVNPNRCKNHGTHGLHPATKEQRDLLFSKMKEAGYYWDYDKKALRNIEQEQTELPKGEDYAIDGLWQAVQILEHSLGEVDGWQSDDGILEHKCAIEAVKRLYEQNTAWSEEDEKKIDLLIAIFEVNHPNGYFKVNPINTPNMEAISTKEIVDWLKSLKERIK